MKPIIKIEKLNITYFPGKNNEVKALQDINMEIYPSEFIILFGPSGCGKSTLMYSIAGLQPNVTGNIYINDKNITKLTPKELEFYHQRKTGMIFQAYFLIPSITVLQNVILPQIAIGEKIKERKKRAVELLEHFGVIAQADKLPLELSGGQQQRVAICRSLINNPDILLADEPVGNLDSESAHDVMFLLQELNQKQKKTVILVTHDPAYLSYAHRVFYIRDGKILETKVNNNVEQIKNDNDMVTPQVPKELELLIRTYSSILPNQIGGLLIPFKAKQIVSEILTGMTLEETNKIEKKVEKLLITGNKDNTTFEFLDKDESKGGMGMDKRIAKYLNEKIQNIIDEIKLLEIKEDINAPSIMENSVKEVRNYLIKTLETNLKDQDYMVIDHAIKERLENKIDKEKVRMILDLPVNKGGAGLDKRTAKKLAQRLELLMLGKYK